MEEITTTTNEQITNELAKKLSEERTKQDDVKVLDAVSSGDSVEPIKPATVADIINSPVPTPGEFLTLIELNDKIKKGEKVKFTDIPPAFQTIIRKQLIDTGINPKDKALVNDFAKMAIDGLVSEFKLDKAFSEFKSELDTALAGKDLFEALLEEDHKRFEEKMPEMAAKFRAEGKEEQAKKLEQASLAYKLAHDWHYCVNIVKFRESEANRFRNGGKYAKRANRFYDDWSFVINKHGFKVTEPIETTIKNFAETFKINFNSVARFFMLMSKHVTDNNDFVHEEFDIKVFTYYSLDILRKLSRSNGLNTESEYVKQLAQNAVDTIKDIDDIVEFGLDV